MRIGRKTLKALLYCGVLASANPIFAEDYSAAEALRADDMRKLIFNAPLEVAEETFSTPEGETFRLSDFQGKVVVVNSGRHGANHAGTRCPPFRTCADSLVARRSRC